jgi:hypothetical protein
VAWKRPDGLAQIMLADYRPGSAWVAARAQELRAGWNATFTVDTASRALIDDASKPSENEQAQAHVGLDVAVQSALVRHGNQPAMNVAAKEARWKPFGTTRVLNRKGAADISPLVAGALALHALNTAPVPEPFMVVT